MGKKIGSLQLRAALVAEAVATVVAELDGVGLALDGDPQAATKTPNTIAVTGRAHA